MRDTQWNITIPILCGEKCLTSTVVKKAQDANKPLLDEAYEIKYNSYAQTNVHTHTLDYRQNVFFS